jgi:hypothetical protein
MTSSVAHGILKMIVMCFSMQEEDIHKHTNGKCYMFTFSYLDKKTFLLLLMLSVIVYTFRSFVHVTSFQKS